MEPKHHLKWDSGAQHFLTPYFPVFVHLTAMLLFFVMKSLTLSRCGVLGVLLEQG